MASSTPNRKTPPQLNVTKGASVVHNGREYVVLRIADLNVVLAREVASGEKVLLKLGSLEPPFSSEREKSTTSREIALEEVEDEAWAQA